MAVRRNNVRQELRNVYSANCRWEIKTFYYEKKIPWFLWISIKIVLDLLCVIFKLFIFYFSVTFLITRCFLKLSLGWIKYTNYMLLGFNVAVKHLFLNTRLLSLVSVRYSAAKVSLEMSIWYNLFIFCDFSQMNIYFLSMTTVPGKVTFPA